MYLTTHPSQTPMCCALIQILHTCEESNKAYKVCQEVLAQLDEVIPDSFDMKGGMVKETGGRLQNISNWDDLDEVDETDDRLRFTFKFYTLMVRTQSFDCSPQSLVTYCLPWFDYAHSDICFSHFVTSCYYPNRPLYHTGRGHTVCWYTLVAK